MGTLYLLAALLLEKKGYRAERERLAEVTDLPEHIQRLYALRLKKLIAEHGFAGDHLKWHESPERRHRAAKPRSSLAPPPPVQLEDGPHQKTEFHGPSGEPISYEQWRQNQLKKVWISRENDPNVIDSIGVAETITLAKAVFSALVQDFLSNWSESNLNSEEFEQRLEGIKESVKTGIRELWRKDEWHTAWFDRAARRKVEDTLAAATQEWVSRARALEIDHLEKPYLGATRGRVHHPVGGASLEIGQGAMVMTTPSRLEIENFANERFGADIDLRNEKYARKQAPALAQTRGGGNVGGYPPALLQCKQERLRAEILIFADALVEAGTTYQVPLPVWAEDTLEKTALQIAGGTLSSLRGELDLSARRTRTRQSSTAGNRELNTAMRSAIREGKLRLKAQRIQAERTQVKNETPQYSALQPVPRPPNPGADSFPQDVVTLVVPATGTSAPGGTRTTPPMTVGTSELTFGLLHFQYRYPKGFEEADQNVVEEVRLKANRTAAEKVIASYDDLSTAKSEWLLEVASGSAPVFGLVATRRRWGANKRRETFTKYVDSAAAIAQVTKPALVRFFESQEWKKLDDTLFPSGDSLPVPKKLGRRPDTGRRGAIRGAINKHGDNWRDHLFEIFEELDAGEIALGVFARIKVDVGDRTLTAVSSWKDLDLAEGEQRAKIVDALRKYV